MEPCRIRRRVWGDNPLQGGSSPEYGGPDWGSGVWGPEQGGRSGAASGEIWGAGGPENMAGGLGGAAPQQGSLGVGSQILGLASGFFGARHVASLWGRLGYGGKSPEGFTLHKQTSRLAHALLLLCRPGCTGDPQGQPYPSFKLALVP